MDARAPQLGFYSVLHPRQVDYTMIALAPPHGPSSHVGRTDTRVHRSVSSSRAQESVRRPPPTPSAPSTSSTPSETTSSTTPAVSTAPIAATAAPVAAPNVTAAPTPSRPTVAPIQRMADGSLDIGAYPSTDLLRLLAALLTQITTENDKLRPQSTPHAPLTPPSDATPDTRAPIWAKLTSASRNALSTPAASLAFHARNIPSISIEQYLLRILKYCPTTNEVFLGLLVYFDRMSKLATECAAPQTPAPHRTLTIDSYNIHRLLIAGVTVASKFFSDVFYTNSRYAKVGGLPQSELNQLELHFLLLNDFRLSIPIDEMQRYAEQLFRYSAGMSPEEAFAPSATAPPSVLAPPSPHTPVAPASPTASRSQPPSHPHRPAHLQLRPVAVAPAGASPGHLSASFSTSSFPKTSHHDTEARAWNAQRRTSSSTPIQTTASDAASIYSVDASESGYGSTTDEDTIRAHWSSSESAMTEGEDDAASTGTVEDQDRDDRHS